MFTNNGSTLQTDITTFGVNMKLAHLGRQALMGVMAVALVAGMSVKSFADEGLLNKVKERGTLLVGLEGTYPPFSFQGDDGKLTGFEVEFAQQLAKHLGVEASLKPTKWDGMLASLDSKRIDVVINPVTISDERKKKYDFSTPYTISGIQALVKKGNEGTIKTADDLKGKKVGVGLGTNYEEWLRQNVQGVDVRTYDDDPTKYQDLRVGRIDAILVDRLAALDLVKKTNDTLAVTGEAFSRQESGVALLENPIGTTAENYLTNGNRLLLDLFNTQIEMCDALTDPNTQLEELATRVEAQGFRPYVIPVGGSNALGALGYVESALEIAQQCEGAVNISSVVVASGSAGTHAGLAVGLEHLMPESELIGVTVSRSVADQLPKVVNLQQAIAKELELTASAEILLWDDYFAPGYGVPNDEGMEAVKLLARLEGILLDPVYTGKAMAGLIDGISQKRFKDEGPILFIHTGGAPALFAYHPHV